MSTIQIEIPDALAKKLAPHHARLVELLELGLQKWMEHEEQDFLLYREKTLQNLAASGKISLPKPYTQTEPYVTHSPVDATGEPTSEVIIEQRGPL